MLNERKKAGFQGKQLKSGTRERLESVNNSATFQLFGSENNRKYFFLLPSLVTSGDPRIRPAFESFSMLSILVFSVPFFEFFFDCHRILCSGDRIPDTYTCKSSRCEKWRVGFDLFKIYASRG